MRDVKRMIEDTADVIDTDNDLDMVAEDMNTIIEDCRNDAARKNRSFDVSGAIYKGYLYGFAVCSEAGHEARQRCADTVALDAMTGKMSNEAKDIMSMIRYLDNEQIHTLSVYISYMLNQNREKQKESAGKVAHFIKPWHD